MSKGTPQKKLISADPSALLEKGGGFSVDVISLQPQEVGLNDEELKQV